MDELTIQLLTDLYSRSFNIQDPGGKKLNPADIHPISLLAAGYKGTIALRKLRGWKFENGKITLPGYLTPNNQDNDKE